jgi:hypothetical protein
VQYIEATDGFGTKVVAAGGADMMMEFAGVYLTRIDAGDPLVLLGGVQVGCFEVFGGRVSGRSAISRASGWPCSGRERPSTCFCPAWWST